MSARGDAALTAAIVATKAATIGFAVDAFLNADSPRLRGKAIRTRAIGYVGALFIVPVAWRLVPEPGRLSAGPRPGGDRPAATRCRRQRLRAVRAGVHRRRRPSDELGHRQRGRRRAPRTARQRPPAGRARRRLRLDRGRDRLGDHGIRGHATRRDRDGPHLRGHDGRPHRRRRRRGDRGVRHHRAVPARSRGRPRRARRSAFGRPRRRRPDIDGRWTSPDLGRSRHAAHRARRPAHPDRPGPRRTRRAASPAGPGARCRTPWARSTRS